MNYNYDVEDNNFENDLILSKIAVKKTADFFSNKGYPVIIEPTFIRPDVSEKNDFSDTGDLRIVITCEVKHRPQLMFSKEVKFKYNTVIIDACHIFDKHKVKPFYYIIWNKDYTSFIFIDVHHTKNKWIKSKKFDKIKNREREFYEIDVNLCTIIDCA